MKNITFLSIKLIAIHSTITGLMLLHAGVSYAATISSFGDLPGSATITKSSPDSNIGSPPVGLDDKSDMTFRFDLTTPSSLGSELAILDIGGGTTGSSVILEADRLVFRVGGNGNIMHVTSTVLFANTTYDVLGSIYIDQASGADAVRFYIDEADAIDTGAAFYNPADFINDWAGADFSGYGVNAGGGMQVGDTGPQNNGAVLDFAGNANGGSLGTISFYDDIFLDVSVIPEPSSVALLGLSGLAAFFLRRRN